MSKRSFRPSAATLKTTLALVFILALAAWLRFWGWDYGLPHSKTRPDEELVVEAVFQMFGRANLAPTTTAYPTLPIYLDASALELRLQWGKLIGTFENRVDMLYEMVVLRPGLQFRICRTVSLAAGLGTVLATFFLGSVGYGKREVGLFGALFLSTALVHVVYSRFATVDVMMTFFVTLAILFAVKASGDGKWSSFALAGLFAGLATASKYNAVLVLFSVLLPALVRFIASEHRTERVSLLGKLAVTGTVAALGFALTSPYSILRYREVLAFLTRLNDTLYSVRDAPAWWVHGRDTFPQGLGWPVYLAALLGLGRALWRRRPADLALLGFAVPFFLSIAGVRLVHPRYVLPLIPLMAVLAAELLSAALSKARIPPAARLAAVALAIPGLLSSIGFDRLAAAKDTRILAAEWVAQHLPKRSKIAVCGGYGAPEINADRRRPPAFEPIEITCTPEAVRATGAVYVVTHQYPPLDRHLRPPLEAFLETRAQVLMRFDPFRQNAQEPMLFYPRDAFYLPLSGFGALTRGGPIVTIWELSDS